jgi:hypothetical protein
MLRSIGAVLLGYVTFMVLITAFAVVFAFALKGKLPDPDAPMEPITTKISIAYVVVGFVFGIAAGYVTAWVARRREALHALALAVFTCAIGVLYFISRLHAQDRVEPLWYLIANLVLPLACVPLGGLLRARHVRARGLAPETV